MKKLICSILSLVMLVSMLGSCNDTSDEPIESTAQDQTEESTVNEETTETPTTEMPESPVEDFEYAENDSGGITITEYIGDETNIVIPSKINQKDVTEIGAFAFTANDNILYVKLPNSITSIKNSAFWHCSSLTTVILSTNLTEIQGAVFEDCSKLENIELPETLTQIGSRAFANCSSLKHITIRSNCLNDYSWGAFDSSGLESVQLPNGIEILANRIFFNTQIKSIVLPSTIKEVDVRAFGMCANLETVILNEGLKTIDYEAFYYTKIVEIIIPETVEAVTEMAFSGCESLKKIKFEGDAPETFIESFSPTIRPDNLNFVIYYHNTAIGFTSPEWYGYTTEIW